MFLAQVIGRVWATIKDPKLEGQRMLIIQPVTPELTPTGKRIIVLDSVGAGAGELVYCCRGKESSFPFLPAEVTTDTCIVGIVDELHVKRPPKESEC
ncbi:MAG: EutN/CcmL family microcompartment protein [Acidobacteria bacterium]|nr:EutN/CcmL family microcompartment protein [Acidobacteriota bacterium]